MTRRLWVLTLAAVMSVSGCGTGGGEGVGGEPYRQASLPELREQARDALARYDDAVGAAGGARAFVPVGSLTKTIGELEPENGDLKESVVAGRLVPAGVFPRAPNARGKIVWADGVSRSVAVLSAGEAPGAHRQRDGDGCDGCAPLTVTAARLVTMRVTTATGEATVPAWEYTLRETALKATYAAVGGSDVVRVTPPPWDPDDPPGGESIDGVSTTGNSTELTVSFTGSSGPASRPCGADYHAEAIESRRAVVVILMTERRHADGDEVCLMNGHPRTETVRLSRPLAGRAVLDGHAGQPIGVTVDD